MNGHGFNNNFTMNEHYMITLALLLVGGIACQILAWRMRLPAILFLLLAGFIAGPVLGIFDPDHMFGDMLFPIVSLGVAVILFEGSLTLRFEEIQKNGHVVWRLVSIGALVTMMVGAYAAHKIASVPLPIALLFGAIVTVTGPTVIMPLLRSVRPNPEVSNILRWEGIVIDPMGAILAVLMFEYITMIDNNEIWIVLGRLLASGTLIGIGAAAILAFILQRHLLPHFLLKITILAAVIGVFTLCDTIQPESGLLAVTIMGIVLANTKGIYLEEILDFKESLSILIISGLFMILSARMDMEVFTQAGWPSILVLLVLVFFARPLGVFLSTIGAKLNWRERALIGWIAPRGIIAAAIAPLFALKLEMKGIENASLLSSLVFIVIVGTVVIQSLTARPLARLLKVSEPEPSGVLIVGANTLARAIGRSLQSHGFKVLLADTNWENVRKARMEGLKTFFGNVVSEHADRHMDLMGIGKLLAVTKRPTLNALACIRFRREFGAKNVFIIKTEEEHQARERDYIADDYSAPFLFGGSITQKQLSQLLQDGREIRLTSITDEFTYDDFLEKYKGDSVPLFAINKRGQLIPYIENSTINPETGWSILSLLPA